MTIATVVVAAGITFVGFTGTVKLRDQLDSVLGWSQQAIDLAYNCLILAVLLLTIVALIYRLPERAAQHDHAIHDLTEFIRVNDARVRAAEGGAMVLSLTDSRAVEERYLTMTAVLPPSTDKQFLKAKRDYARKKEKSKAADRSATKGILRYIRDCVRTRQDRAPVAQSGPVDAVSGPAGGEIQYRLESIVRRSPQTMAILKLLNEEDEFELWLTGGAVRNLVWDAIHNYGINTPIDDIDVVWFDDSHMDAEIDHELEIRLTKKAPNLNWDVKNQARMSATQAAGAHSLDEAMKVWPEKASAVALRLNAGKLVHLAPFGLEDLFGLRLGPPTQAEDSRFQRRLKEKQWQAKWPLLRVTEQEDDPTQS
jgi:uncharacterized protein